MIFLHTMPVWDINANSSFKVIRPLKSIINYLCLPLYLEQQTIQMFFLITTKVVQHLVQYVSIGTASNETLTFNIRFQTTSIFYF